MARMSGSGNGFVEAVMNALSLEQLASPYYYLKAYRWDSCRKFGRTRSPGT
jgi:hypothetical protein